MQQAAAGAAGARHFWGQFLAALGRQPDGSNDLLTASDPGSVTLDAVQLSLLSQRLAGDLYAFGRSSEPSAATWTGRGQAAPTPPCSMGSVEGTIFDTSALGYGYGFGKLLEYLEEQGLGAAGSFARLSGVANLVLSYVKLTWTLGAFHAAIALDGAPPLVRTKQQRPATGEQRQLTATLRMDTGQAQLVNCLRPMLNAAGLDLSLPSDGAIAGAELHWRGGMGFVQGTDLSGRIVEFYGDTQGQASDERGQGRIGVEGFGQEQALSDQAVPVLKQAAVTLSAVIQPANLVQDLLSATSAASGGLLGVLQLPAEMLTRSSLAFESSYSFPVQDWQQPRFHAEGSFDWGFAGSGVHGGQAESFHGTFDVDFTVEGDGSIDAHGTATVTFSSHADFDDGDPRFAYHCTQPTATQDVPFHLTGSAENQTLNLVFTPEGSLPVCPGGSNLPVTRPPLGFPLQPVILPERDGADATVPSAPQAPGYSGSFHIHLSVPPPGQ